MSGPPGHIAIQTGGQSPRGKYIVDFTLCDEDGDGANAPAPPTIVTGHPSKQVQTTDLLYVSLYIWLRYSADCLASSYSTFLSLNSLTSHVCSTAAPEHTIVVIQLALLQRGRENPG